MVSRLLGRRLYHCCCRRLLGTAGAREFIGRSIIITSSSSHIMSKASDVPSSHQEHWKHPSSKITTTSSKDDSTMADNRSNNEDSLNIMSNFQELVKASRGAKRYKVHAPHCSCSKVVKMFGEKGNASATHNDFLVVPDIKPIAPMPILVGGHSARVAATVGSGETQKHSLQEETSIKELIFPSSSSDFNNTVKVSCAACMLEVEPNGFVCISSPIKAEVDRARDMAIKAREVKAKNGQALHADHADYVCTLHQGALEEEQQKTAPSSSSSSSSLIQQLQEQNVPVVINNQGQIHRPPKLKIGHHLKTMLKILQKRNMTNEYLLTIVAHNDQNHTFEMDLPGGKRHLAETSFACAVRELEEETSLVVDETWRDDDSSTTGRIEEVPSDIYYLLRPPPSPKPKQEDDLTLVERLDNLQL